MLKQNVFDQFDAPKEGATPKGNIFDQFDNSLPQEPGFSIGGVARTVNPVNAAFGLGDELEGLGAALGTAAYDFIEGDGFSFDNAQAAYTNRRDTTRREQKQFDDRNPKLSQGLSVIGSIPTLALPLGSATSVANLAKIGAAEGAVAGFGASESETAGGLLQDTAVGAATGAVFAPAISKLGSGVVEGLAKLPGLKSIMQGTPTVRARNEIRQWAREHDIPNSLSQVVGNELELLGRQAGGDARLADADMLQSLVLGVNKNVPLSFDRQASLEGRALDQQLRASEFLESEAQSKTNLLLRADNAVRDASAEANDFYRAAYSEEFDIRPISNLKGDSNFTTALGQARQQAANEFAVTGNPPSTMKVLDYAQRNLQDMGKRSSGNEARLIYNARTQLVEEMRTQSPNFRTAQEIIAEGNQFADGIRTGLGVPNKMTLDETKLLVRKASDEAKRGLREGADRTLRERLESGIRNSDGGLIKSSELANYGAVQPNGVSGTFNDALEAERAFNRTREIAERSSGNRAAEVTRQLNERVGDDTASAFSVANLFTGGGNPVIGGIFAASRIGKSLAPRIRADQKRMYQAMQDELYKRVDRPAVNDLLAGELEKVPLDDLNKMFRIIGITQSGNAAKIASQQFSGSDRERQQR